MIRLSPRGHQRIERTPIFEAYAVERIQRELCACCTVCAPDRVSRLVDNPLHHARASGMDTSEVVWVPYDGSGRADRIGLNSTEVVVTGKLVQYVDVLIGNEGDVQKILGFGL